MNLFDTNILSTFAKEGRLDLLKEGLGDIYIFSNVLEKLLFTSMFIYMCGLNGRG